MSLTRRTFLGSLAAGAATAQTVRPNFVYIMADDLGYGDIGCYGNRAIRTPQIDGLARTGVRFTQFYSGSSLCTPSRAALITGRYAPRTGLVHPLAPVHKIGLAASEVTVAETLRGAGYATAIVGKWHLGTQTEYNPVRHGFDYYYGVPYSNDQKPFTLLRNEEVLAKEAEQDTLTDSYTREAVGFIERSAKAGKPFFLYLAHNMPHDPVAAPERLRGKSRAGSFGDAVENLDESTGTVLDTLRRLKLDRNTMVVFTSDNGPWFDGSAGSLRGRKAEQYEGGSRVPFLASWPGRIRPGTVCDVAAMNINIHPTFAALAGTKVQAELDGRDMSGLLLGTRREPVNDLFLFFWRERLHAARMGQWKLHLAGLDRAPYMRVKAFRDGKAEVKTDRLLPEPYLYNLAIDPDESYNVAPQHPDVVREITGRMKQAMLTFPEPVRKVQLIQ